MLALVRLDAAGRAVEVIRFDGGADAPGGTVVAPLDDAWLEGGDDGYRGGEDDDEDDD